MAIKRPSKSTARFHAQQHRNGRQVLEFRSITLCSHKPPQIEDATHIFVQMDHYHGSIRRALDKREFRRDDDKVWGFLQQTLRGPQYRHKFDSVHQRLKPVIFAINYEF